MKKNWQKLRKNIPNKLHVGYGKYYQVLWQAGIENASDVRTYGITRFDPEQIVIDSTQSDKEAIYTVFHEYIHALDDAHGIKLTEKQVRQLEKCFSYIYEFILTIEGKGSKLKGKGK